jgi:glyoxylase-like metal-dependent hydrolase (beta-lactamase superfamily II)
MKLEMRTVGAFQENAYLIVDDGANCAILVDPGAEADRLTAMVRASGATLDAIWLTHAHIDHIGAIAGVQREWSVPVYMHPADLPLYRRAAQQAALYGLPFEQPDDPQFEISDGDRLRVGSISFDVIHTPGHSPGHVVFQHADTVLGGDLLFAGSIGRTDLPLSDPARMEESLARICELDDATLVYPGHGPATRLGHERATNGYLKGAPRIVKR